MAVHLLTGVGAIQVEGLGTKQLTHNLSGAGSVRVEGSGNVNMIHVLAGVGAVRVEGQADLVPVLPAVSSVTTSSPTAVRVVFDTPMQNDTALADPTNYTIVPLAGAVQIAVLSATPEAVANPTYVDLVTTEHTDSGSYQGEANNVFDEDGLPIDLLANTAAYTGLGNKPQVATAVAVSATKIRVTFNEPMDPNGTEIENPLNYSVIPTAGGASVFVRSVVLPIDTNPTFIELVTSEMTDGAAYETAVDSSGPIRDAAFNPLDSAFDTAAFTGVGVAPELFDVLSLSSTRVDVVFSENMKDNADIRNPNKYVWDNGLLTLSVLALEGTTVKLATTEQVEGLVYQLTIG